MIYKFFLSQSFDAISLDFQGMPSDIKIDVGFENINDFTGFVKSVISLLENSKNKDFKEAFDIDTQNLETVHFIMKPSGDIAIFTKNGIDNFYISPIDIANSIVDKLDLELIDNNVAELDDKKHFMNAYLKLKNAIGKISEYVKYDKNLTKYRCAFEYDGCNKMTCGTCEGCYGFELLVTMAKELKKRDEELEEE